MTIPGATASLPRKGATSPRPAPSSAAAPPPLSINAARLLALLRASASRTEPITQLEAGQRIGFKGADDTVRRKVQHLRDEINDSGRAFVCSSWGNPPGMWVARDDDEINEYADKVLGRAYTTVAQFKGIQREKRLQIAREIQGLLDLDDGPRDQGQPGEGDLPCTANPGPGRRPTDDVPNGEKCGFCNEPLKGRQTVACCDEHRDILNGRRSLPI